jgi:hypothetical protein
MSMMRLAPALVAAWLGAPAVADACTCVARVEVLGNREAWPANGLLAIEGCGAVTSSEPLAVWVDGEPARLVAAGIDSEPEVLLLRIEPPPLPGQTITFDPCADEQDYCPYRGSAAEWTAMAADHAPPQASVGALVVERGDEQDGTSCAPHGPSFIVKAEDVEIDEDVELVRVQVVRDGVAIASHTFRWRLGSGPDFELRVAAVTSEPACIRVSALDAAGNETRIGEDVCDLEPPPGAVQDRGCACTSSPGAGAWGLLLTLCIGLRRRAR